MSRFFLALDIAWRYFRGRRSQILSSTAFAALAAIVLGVTAMVVAMALMSGYTNNLQRKLFSLQGEIFASPLGRDELEGTSAEIIARIEQIRGVASASRVAYGEGSLTSEAVPEGINVVLRGVDRGVEPGVPIPAPQSRGGVTEVLLGSELERQLEVEIGDTMRLVVLDMSGPRPRFRYRSVRSGGSFASGFAEFDSSWVIVERNFLERAGAGNTEYFEITLDDPSYTDAVATELEATLGSSWLIRTWRTINREIFAALELQETLLFLVLGLIVVVSTFNVASTLVVLIREKLADIGVLGALGIDPRQLWAIFALYGVTLGASGIVIGVATGSGLSWLVTELELISFGPEIAQIYFIDSVPFLVEAKDLLAIGGFALAITALSCSLPALRAVRISPAVALRDE